MHLTAIITICHATVHGLLSPLLVYLGYGALGAVVGSTVAYTTSGIVALALLYFTIFRKLKPDTMKRNIIQSLKPMLGYGVPLAISVILSSGLTQLCSFIMASSVDSALIGNYRIAVNFAVLLTFFVTPISTVLFPAFSKLDLKDEPHLLKSIFSSSVKYTGLFLAPATLAMIVLSTPLISSIYAGKWLSAPFFLSLYVISNLFTILGSLSMSSLFYALGETRMLMKLNIINLCVGAPLAFLLIPTLEIVGLILCTIVAGIPNMFIGLHWIWKHYGTKADFGSSAKIFLASSIAAITTYLFLTVFSAAAWLTLTGGVIIFLAIYLIAAPLIGAINQTDINNLRSMFVGLGIISKLLDVPLTLMEKPLKIRLHRAETIN